MATATAAAAAAGAGGVAIAVMAHGGGGSHDHSHEHGGHGSHVGHNVEAGELTGCGEDGRTRPPQAEINLAEVKANQRYGGVRCLRYYTLTLRHD